MLIRRLTSISLKKHHKSSSIINQLSSKQNKLPVTTLISSSTLLNANKSYEDQYNKTQIYTGSLTGFLRKITAPCLVLSTSPLVMAIYSQATLIQYTQQSYLLSFIAGVIPLAALYQYRRVYITQIEHHSSAHITRNSSLILTTEPMFKKINYTECKVDDIKLVEKITTIIHVKDKDLYLDSKQCEASDEGGVFWRFVLEKYRLECEETKSIHENDRNSNSEGGRVSDSSLMDEKIEYGLIACIFVGFFSIGALGVYFVMKNADIDYTL